METEGHQVGGRLLWKDDGEYWEKEATQVWQEVGRVVHDGQGVGQVASDHFSHHQSEAYGAHY